MNHRKSRRKGNAERFLSILLAVVMVLSLMPENALTFVAYAEESIAEDSVEENTGEKPSEESGEGETAEESDEKESEEESVTEESSEESTTGEPSEENTEEKPADEDTTEKPAEESTEEKPADGDTGENLPEESTEEKPADGDAGEEPSEESGEGETTEEGDEKGPEEENAAEESPEEGTGEKPEEENAGEKPEGEDTTEKPADEESAEESLCPHHEQHTEDCGYGEDTPCGYVCKICPVQELIDALPDVNEITAENAADVEKQLAEIDEAKEELTDEELDALDITKYEAAVSALLALEDMEGADKIQTLEGTGAFTVTGGTEGTDYSYADGVLTVKTDAALTISGASTSDRIEVENGVSASITLSGVSIDVSSTDDMAAFRIADDSTGSVTITLDGTNTLKSGANCAGLQKNGDSGTLTITGDGSLTVQGGDQAAGIGGGLGGSGTGICITGGIIKAYGGSTKAYSEDGNSVSGNFGGAGIGGGLGGSGTVTISGDANVTAQGAAGAAGIGAGRCSSIGVGAKGTVTIEGGTVIATGGLTPGFSGNSGAGIGAGQSSHAEVTITGGTVTATGGSSGRGMGKGGAGIGGSGGFGNATVKISGGTVTAKGGDDKNGGAGIGGSSSDNADVTITGGVVTATGGSDISSDGSGKPGAGIGLNGNGNGSATFSTESGNAFIIATGGAGAAANGDGITGGENTSGWSGIIFNGDEGQVYGSQTLTTNAEIPAGKNLTIPSGATFTVNSTLTNEGTLTIDGGTLSGTDTLGGNGSFLTTELTADMITVPTGLFYNGSDRAEYIKQNTKLATKTYCGKEFQVTGWTQSVTKDPSSDLIYTVTYTRDGTSETITKNVTLEKSGTEFVDTGAVKTYNGDTAAAEFTYGETITVKAAPTATGQAPAAARSRLRGLTQPTSGQMAVYYNDTQVSAAASSADGEYTMTVPVKDLIAAGAEYGSVTLTAKFVGNDYMADGEGTVTVTLKPATLSISGAALDAKTYDGTKTATVDSVTFSGVVDGDILTMGEDGGYTATAEFTDENAGTGKTAIVTVTLTNGNYTFADGTKEATYTLDGQTISPREVTGTVAVEGQYEYNGGADIIPDADNVTVTYMDDGGKKVTIPGDEYTFTCSDNTEVGTATLTLSDAEGGNYKVSGEGIFQITKSSLATAKVTLSETSYTYDGTEKTPTVTVKKGNAIVAANEYTISYSNESGVNGDHTNAGTVTVTITAKEGGHYSGSKSAEFTISRAPLPEITLAKESVTYNGSEQKPTVTAHGLTEGTDYEISYTRSGTVTSDFANAGEITVTATGKGNYTGTTEKTYIIAKAAPQIAWGSTSRELYYTGKMAEITAPTVTLVNGETFSGTVSYSYEKEGTTVTGLPAEAGTYQIKAGIAASGNYTAAGTADMLTLTIKYYDGEIPVKFTANGNELTEAAWVTPATKVTITASGFTVAAVAAGGARPADSAYDGSITMPAGDVAKMTFYFKQTQPDTGYMTDGIQYTLKVDGNPPGGSIKLNYKFWDSFLSAISFGHYQAAEKAVTITAADNESGVKTTEYIIVTGGTSYASKDELEAADLSWQTYSPGSKPTVDVNTRSVIYAKLTDNVGNVTYLSSEGILMDETPPAISGFSIKEDSVTDVQAQASITVDETAAIYLVAVPTAEADKITVEAKDVIATCDADAIGAADGTKIPGVAWHGTLAAGGGNLTGTKEITGLAPDTEYTVYAAAVDKVIDMDKTTGSNIAYTGNVSMLSSIIFTTKKAQPVTAQAPVISGTYGQTIGDMLTPGTAKDKNGAVLTGIWTVSTADQNKTPSVGTTEEITVTFKPDDDGYDSIEVTIPVNVSPRNLSAEGAAISQVAGTYTYDNGNEIKPPVALGTGDPTKGVYISDSGATLTIGDFTVSYSNNKNAGTAAVTITGKGNYTGSVTRKFTIGKAAGRVIPDLTGAQTQEKDTYTYTITPTEGAVYRMGESGEWTGKNVFTGITPGATVTFFAKMPENENYEEGDAKSITVTFEKLTPAAPPLSYTRSTDKGMGKITITINEVDGAEYSFDGGSTWGDANVKDGFNSSQTVTLAIRLKETDTHKESPVQKVTVNLAKEDRKAPDQFKLEYEANGETDYTVTIPPTEGCEYSFDGAVWSDDNVRAGVKAGETVTGYKRYKETGEYNASGAVSDTETMPRFTVKTPVISPAGGSFDGSVSVAITCGTPGAEVYYTTDGSTPTRSSARYTGAFTVTPPAAVKAVAVKEGLTDSAVATAQYTEKDSGDDENNPGNGNSGGGQGTGGGDGGNTAPAAPAGPPASDADTNPGAETTPAAPGTGTAPVKPGTGNEAKPGSQTRPGNGNTAGPGNSDTQESSTDKEKPFIKGENGKIGWDVIRAEEEKAAVGSVINVDMNGATVVPGDIFDSIKGRDITITFDMDNGIIWSVDGKSITRDASRDKAGDIDFSVKTGVSAVPVDIVNNVTGEGYSIQLSLAHEGEFGFTAVLSINLGKENAGYTASLYHYNESTGELEFICKDTVTEEGTASLAFTHASDYVIAIDGEEEESGTGAEPAQPEGNSGNDDNVPPESPKTVEGKKNVLWPIVAGVVVLAGIAFAGVFAWKKKEEKEEDK